MNKTKSNRAVDRSPLTPGEKVVLKRLRVKLLARDRTKTTSKQ